MDQKETTQQSAEDTSMRLRVATLHWAGCLTLFIILAYIAAKFNSGVFANLAFLAYFGSGIYLGRAVLRRIIEWHPTYSTLYNVTSAKLWMFFLWPAQYFFLFMRLGINKVL